jgi:hypothetical protein
VATAEMVTTPPITARASISEKTSFFIEWLPV